MTTCRLTRALFYITRTSYVYVCSKRQENIVSQYQDNHITNSLKCISKVQDLAILQSFSLDKKQRE
jgi:hypothetical protein